MFTGGIPSKPNPWATFGSDEFMAMNGCPPTNEAIKFLGETPTY
jgi:hypothetical protein